MRRWWCGIQPRITETELAARNRRAGFPAPLGFADRETKRDPQHVARSRRPRPSSTATARAGGVCEVNVRPASGALCSWRRRSTADPKPPRYTPLMPTGALCARISVFDLHRGGSRIR